MPRWTWAWDGASDKTGWLVDGDLCTPAGASLPDSMERYVSQVPARVTYVGSRTSRHRDRRGRGIKVFRIADDGQWAPLQTVAMANPTYLVQSPSKQRLHPVYGNASTVSVLDVDPRAGLLSEAAEVDSGGVNPFLLTITPDSRFVLIANHINGAVESLPILPGEGLGEPVSILELVGEPGPHRRDQNGSKPHQVMFDPSGRLVTIPGKGTEPIYVPEVDTSGGLGMDPGRTVRLREFSGPRHLVFHLDGTAAYSIEESRSTVTRCDWDADRGRLAPQQVVSSLPEEMTSDSRAVEIALNGGGNHLYICNRGGDSDHTPGDFRPDTVGVFDRVVHRVTNPRWTGTLGIRPRFFCLDPPGSSLLAAHKRGHSSVEHHLDPTTGDIAPGVERATTGSPVCVIFHDLDD